MSDILKHDTVNTTKSASNINASKSKLPPTFDDVMNVLNSYFSAQSRDQSRTYKDGNVHLIREDFDIISFVNTINQMAESYIKTETHLENEDASQISEVFKAIKTLTTLLRRSFNTQDIEYLFIVRLLSYCTYSYNKYHNSYARSRKIQKENGNAES